MFGAVYDQGGLVFPRGARVLEVGCAEADWMTPIMAARPDLQITGIDWRPAPGRPGQVIQGDVLTHDWPAASFDVMVGISSIEHIGLGHYDADPLDPDGDRHCMARVCRWLKPGGWVYLDVPYDPAGYRVEGTSHRVYDDAAVTDRLLAGFTRQQTWYFAHERVGTPLDAAPMVVTGMVYVAVSAIKDMKEH
jgi:hypothetical protein